MNFGEKVRELRKQNGWSQEELARKLGVSLRTICTYEHGKYPRYQKTYEDLAAIFEVDVNYLRTENEEFLTDVSERYGQRGQDQAKAILDQTQQLFAGGSLSPDDELAFIHEIQRLYFDSKERAKKYTPKKYLKSEDHQGV